MPRSTPANPSSTGTSLTILAPDRISRMKRLGATVLFELAVAGATLAGGGLVVAPHAEARSLPRAS